MGRKKDAAQAATVEALVASAEDAAVAIAAATGASDAAPGVATVQAATGADEPNRQKFLGGSDVAAVLGLSPWRTRVELWRDKITPRDPDAPKKRVFKRGHRWEAVVAEMLVEALQELGHTVEIVATNRRYVDGHHDFLACEIDFELRLNGEDEITNCELKTVHPFKSKEWGESFSDDTPVHYTAQVMHGLGITARRRGILAALFGADELRVYEIVRDDQTIDWMRAQAVEFWTTHVLGGVPPEPEEDSDIDVLYPHPADPEVTVEATDEIVEAVLRMRAIAREIKAREGEYEVLEYMVKRFMGTAALLTVNGKKAITWDDRPFTRLDFEKLKEEHKDVHKACTKKGVERIFTLKQFAWNGAD